MSNKLHAANAALWQLVEATFAASAPVHNPGGAVPPKAPPLDGMTGYVAMDDDMEPEVTGTLLTGPVYELKAAPVITFAFNGQTKEKRTAAAWLQVEILKAALAADRRLGGAVDWADLEEVVPIYAAQQAWMIGGLEVRPRLLFSAPSRVG